jgi:CRP/FNR family transcriptional regulator, cyclic AMP receptor protein
MILFISRSPAVNPLWSNIFRKKSEEDSLAYFLKSVPIFSELKGRDFGFLESLVHIRRYDAGEVVFEEGDPGSGMYVIRSGSVKVFSRTENGREEELATLGGGDFFGETTLTAPAARAASARTLESTELVGLFRADLLELAQKHPAIANRILLGVTRIVSERLQAAGQEIRRLRQAQEAVVATSIDTES